MTTRSRNLPFDLAEATRWLSERDEHLKRLIEETRAFELRLRAAPSPYDALVEAITYQSISGKAARRSSNVLGRSAPTAACRRRRRCSGFARPSCARWASRRQKSSP